MPHPTFDILNTADPKSVDAYEQALYIAFEKYSDDPVTDMVWDVYVDAERITPRVPYTDQLIGVVWQNGVVMAAGAVNLNPRSTWQLEMLGFTVDKTEAGVCEAVVIFSNQSLSPKPDFLLFSMVGERLGHVLRTEHQINVIYASCAERVLSSYLQLGWTIVDARDIRGTRETMISMRL